MKRDAAVRAFAIVGFVLALAGAAWANGEEFFAPAKDGTIDLVYFGRIKDSQTGRSITDSVYFVLTDKSTGLSFPFTNDKPGHFRTPDVGAAIKEIGEQIDVSAFAIDVNVAGYKRATITRMPRKAAGAIELAVKLDPIVPDEVAAAGLNIDNARPVTRIWILAAGICALLLIVKVVRTSSRPPTTTH